MKRRSGLVQLERIFKTGVLAVVIGFAGYLGVTAIQDHIAHGQALARAQHDFPLIRARIVQRLRQRDPIELGAVWATHTGRICGLVNGEGSFGGLTGMEPFYVDGGHVHYGLETDHDTFDRAWMGCGADPWVEIVRGSTQEGFCATREGAKRCHWSTDKSSG